MIKLGNKTVNMDKEILYSKLMTLPEELMAEVADFIDYLIAKSIKSRDEPNPSFPNQSLAVAMEPS
jgi:hypothetical protein